MIAEDPDITRPRHRIAFQAGHIVVAGQALEAQRQRALDQRRDQGFQRRHVEPVT